MLSFTAPERRRIGSLTTTLSRWRALLALLLGLSLLPLQAPAQGKRKRPDLRIAYVTHGVNWVDFTTMEAAARPLLDLLSRKHQISYQLVSASSVEELGAKMKRGEVNMAMAWAIDYVRIEDRVKIKPMALIELNSARTTRMQLVARRGGVAGLGQLKGKRLSIYLGDPNVSIFLKTLVHRAGATSADALFVKVMRKHKHPSALLDVFFGEADVCLVPSATFATMRKLNPQLAKKLVVIEQSPVLANGLMFTRADMPAKTHAALKKVALGVHTIPEGKQLLLITKLGRMWPVPAGALDTARALWREHQKVVNLAKRGSAP